MATRQARPKADAEVLVFTATMARGLYRTFEIGAFATLYDLAAAILAVFDFDFDHAFGF